MVVVSGNKSEQVIMECRKLWKECFDDSEAYLDFYQQRILSVNKLYLDYEDDQLVAMLHANPTTLCLNGKQVQSTYIVGVATSPAYRHQGRMKQLLTAAIQDAQFRGEQCIYLMPARKGLYERFGFTGVYETKECEGELVWGTNEALKGRRDSTQCKLVSVETDCEQLADWINRFLITQNTELYSLRNSDYYKREYAACRADNGEILSLVSGRQIMGSITLYRTQRVDGSTNYEITECIVANEDANAMWKALVRWLEDDTRERCVHGSHARCHSVWITVDETQFVNVDFWREHLKHMDEKERQVIMVKPLTKEGQVRSCYMNELQ